MDNVSALGDYRAAIHGLGSRKHKVKECRLLNGGKAWIDSLFLLSEKKRSPKRVGYSYYHSSIEVELTNYLESPSTTHREGTAVQGFEKCALFSVIQIISSVCL